MSVVGPGGTLGILGGGQLGRMLAMSARQHGYGVVVLAPLGDAPAVGLADHAFRAAFEDLDAARALALRSDVVTYEFENVPAATARALEGVRPLRPGENLLAVTQDRLEEHAFLHAQGVPTASGWPVQSGAELEDGLVVLGLPAARGRLKAARGGYDGGGQWTIRTVEDVARVREVVATGGAFLLERDVPFSCEISVIVTRGVDGAVEVFPVFENEHRDGILHLTRAPARVPLATARRAQEIARTLAIASGLVGTLTVECFVVGDEVLVNELAPRVHNSGHLTLEACNVSQFEQHLRAVCGLPLLRPGLVAPAAMVNLLGSDDVRPVRWLGAEDALALPDVHLHVYGKGASRARRKLGHVTAVRSSLEEAVSVAEAAARMLRVAPSVGATVDSAAAR